ncbi:dTDP-4-dehydrorhamnose 3,5-epimerase family protein [Roseicyclus mahoneyensis]|uniref:dTDP-4-dehydrorhamnose 3,5-epimerase n=1 Tax=Roseicyclus mahoneyensis TaxID=164332 RepID=A0A316GI31_9RHOB|nr:dTDP-4-dehydrorhamnose 3,5-epimerase family protein [Roseicyclus mahoneyensis]PWK59648.1 dTDP-4-dehydrorhamnose 3,5-epimerase [Roseicyclus mahoneyensis]
MIFHPLKLHGAFRIALNPREDTRGFFARFFCTEEFRAQGLLPEIAQINTSFSRAAGTVRGLHFQRPPAADSKVVRCLRGAIRDVIVDLRARSPQFGQWEAVDLTAENRDMVYVPPGFAHGFQTLLPDTELLYLHGAAYSPAHEGGVAHDDPELGIDWALPVANLSPRDAALPRLHDLEPLAT